MKKNIYHIGGILLLCVGFVVIGGWSGYGQSHVTDELRSEFAKGNRDSCFLKKYMAALKADKSTDELSVALDSYLIALPFGQRYTDGNVADFIHHIKGMEATSLLDIVINWDKISITDEQKKMLMEKIDQNCSVAMFDWTMNREKSPGLRRPDSGKLQQALVGSPIPLSGSKRILIDMWETWGKENVQRLVDQVRQMFTKSCRLEGIADWYVLGEMLNYLLENVNGVQCEMVLVILDDVLKKPGEDIMMSMVKGMKDNFEGKKMMSELNKE